VVLPLEPPLSTHPQPRRLSLDQPMPRRRSGRDQQGRHSHRTLRPSLQFLSRRNNIQVPML
jgi:hypothetical protein